MEFKIAQQLKEHLREGRYLPFVITKEVLYWQKGEEEMARQILFPGYVMIKADLNALTESDIVNDMRIIVDDFSHIMKVLSYGSDENILISESEQAVWESLLDSDFCIRASEGIFAENKLKVTSGALVGKESLVKKYSLRKRKAFLDVEFADEMMSIGLVLKINDIQRKEEKSKKR